jgi:hypothetical protein
VLRRAAVVAVGAGNGSKRNPDRFLLCCRKGVRNQELKRRNRPILVCFIKAAVACLRCKLALALLLVVLCGRQSSHW